LIVLDLDRLVRVCSLPISAENSLLKIHSKGKKQDMKLFVGNFPFSTTEADLQSLFAPYGNIDSVTVVTDRQTGRSRGFGFVEMSDRGEAEKAIEALNGKEVGGRALNVNEARPKNDGGGYRGGRGGSQDDYRGHARQPREPRW
jgi:RNA recognition motif-containing protein